MQKTRRGGCSCGAVRIETTGDPIRTGLCHCLACRKETGGPFMAFAVWDRSMVLTVGKTASCMASTDHRPFCPVC
jgi:hypothetical protein